MCDCQVWYGALLRALTATGWPWDTPLVSYQSWTPERASLLPPGRGTRGRYYRWGKSLRQRNFYCLCSWHNIPIYISLKELFQYGNELIIKSTVKHHWSDKAHLRERFVSNFDLINYYWTVVSIAISILWMILLAVSDFVNHPKSVNYRSKLLLVG